MNPQLRWVYMNRRQRSAVLVSDGCAQQRLGWVHRRHWCVGCFSGNERSHEAAKRAVEQVLTR